MVITIILVSSSVTCQWGVFAAERGNVYGLRIWFTISFVLGLAFILGQGNEYHNLIREGTTISSTGYGSVFFLTRTASGGRFRSGVAAVSSPVVRARVRK